MIIGNKHEFGVEIKFLENSTYQGYGKIWIKNDYYGTIEDLIFFSYLINLVENLLESIPINEDLKDRTPSEIYDILRVKSQINSKYLITSSTFTDDFIGYKFIEKDEISLIWKLRSDQDIIFEELKIYDHKIRNYSIERSKVDATLSSLKHQLEEMDLNS